MLPHKRRLADLAFVWICHATVCSTTFCGLESIVGLQEPERPVAVGENI
jgi:hypothetical protein